MTAEETKAFKGRGWLLNKGTETFSARVVTGNGKVTAEQVQAVADAARAYGNGVVTLTVRQTFEVPGVPAASIDAFEAALARVGLSVGGTGPRVRPVVSCKGTLCPRGLIDTFSLSEAIHRRFYVGWHGVALPGKFKIGVGGCPNNCIKPDLNDIGVAGAVLPGAGRPSGRGKRACVHREGLELLPRKRPAGRAILQDVGPHRLRAGSRAHRL